MSANACKTDSFHPEKVVSISKIGIMPGVKPEKSGSFDGKANHTTPTPLTTPVLRLPNAENVAKQADKKANTKDRRWFKFDGRKYRLEMRPESPFWTLSFETTVQNGSIKKKKVVKHSTKTTDGALAEKNARLFLENRRDQNHEALKAMQGRSEAVAGRLGDIFQVAPRLAVRGSVETRHAYVMRVRMVFQRALKLKDPAEVDLLPFSAVNAENGRAYFVSVLHEASQMQGAARQNTFKRSACNSFGQAMALFCDTAVESMKTDFGLKVPDFAPFRKWHGLGRDLLGANSASEFHAPSDSIQRKTFREWLKIGRTPGYKVAGGDRVKTMEIHELSELDRRNLFIAIGLMISCGLRKSEVQQVKWKWFQRHGGRPLLCDGDIDQKNSEEHLQVRPLDPFWALMNKIIDENGWRGEPDDTCLIERPKAVVRLTGNMAVLNGGHCDRTYWPFFFCGRWVRSMGWRMQKSCHALRDLAASLITMKFGLDRAKIFCRHATITTTESHYGRFVDEDIMDDPTKLRWLRWAK